MKNSEIFFVHASIVDKNNTMISDFKGSVLFNIEGKGELIGENPVNFEAGIASILLKTTNLNNVKVTATSNTSKQLIHNF